MIRYTPGNAVDAAAQRRRILPGAGSGHRRARAREIWLETYIFADDPTGRRDRRCARARRAARRRVRVLVDGWGARHYLTRALERELREGGVRLLKYRPEVAPWQFRSHRLRRLHRKLCHVDGGVAFVGGINIIDDMNTPHQKPPRVDFAVRVRGAAAARRSCRRCSALWALVELRAVRSAAKCRCSRAPIERRAARASRREVRRSATTCAIAATSSAPISPPIRTAQAARSSSPTRTSFRACASAAR